MISSFFFKVILDFHFKIIFLGTCAVLNNQTHNLDSVPCKAKEGCPDKPYSPRELYNCKCP